MSGSEGPLKREVEDWLRSELVLDGPRRIIRIGADRVQISKVDRDFAAELHRLLAKLPELCSESRVLTAYARRAQVASSETLRSENWRACMYELLSQAARRTGIPDVRCAEVRAGIDSVFVVLESVLWSQPCLRDDYVPVAAERRAYRESFARLAPDRDLFTRVYGTFEGRVVESRCPGAEVARTMFAHAWTACTGSPPPVEVMPAASEARRRRPAALLADA